MHVPSIHAPAGPVDVHGFSPARRGEYRLHSTSETVYDPDLISSWEITRPVPWL